MGIVQINNFALIVPAKQRQYNIPRAVEYYKGLKAKKIILDSSTRPYPHKNIINNAGFEHVICDPNAHFSKNIIPVLKKLDAEFVLDVPDDDIAIIKSISECVSFLKTHQEFSTCNGMFYVAENKYKTLPKWPGTHYKCDSLASCKDINERLKNTFSKYYFSRHHSVMRTSTMQFIHSNFMNTMLRWEIYAYEYFFTFLAMLHGRGKILPNAFCIRMPLNIDRVINRPKIKQKWRRNQFQKEWADAVAEAYSKKTSSTIEESKEFIISILSKNIQKAGAGPSPKIIENKQGEEIKKVTSMMWDTYYKKGI